MPHKGKEALSRHRKTFNKLDMNEIKSSIRKMADYATSSSNSNDSFADGDEVATIHPNNVMEFTESQPNVEVTKEMGKPKIPNFKKKPINRWSKNKETTPSSGTPCQSLKDLFQNPSTSNPTGYDTNSLAGRDAQTKKLEKQIQAEAFEKIAKFPVSPEEALGNFQKLKWFSGRDPDIMMFNQQISQFLEKIVKANEIFADNEIQNPMAYLEFASLYYALAEEARALNKSNSCPSSCKNIWIQISLDCSDSGWSSTAIKIRFRKDGPLKDLEARRNFISRSGEFLTYFDETNKELSRNLNNIPDDDTVDGYEDIDDLKSWVKMEFGRIKAFHETVGQINSINLDRFEQLSKMNSDQIMDDIAESDRPAQTGLILRHLERFNEPLVLLDHSLTFTPLRFNKNSEQPELMEPPQWLKDIHLQKNGRPIAFGNPELNHKRDFNSYKLKYAAEADAGRKLAYKQRDQRRKQEAKQNRSKPY